VARRELEGQLVETREALRVEREQLGRWQALAEERGEEIERLKTIELFRSSGKF
jgi:hypothetical protein